MEYEGLTYVTVRGAGHMVPLKKPSEALSHVIYAASDMFIIPSIFEPCGLTQVMVKMDVHAFHILRNLQKLTV